MLKSKFKFRLTPSVLMTLVMLDVVYAQEVECRKEGDTASPELQSDKNHMMITVQEELLKIFGKQMETMEKKIDDLEKQLSLVVQENQKKFGSLETKMSELDQKITEATSRIWSQSLLPHHGQLIWAEEFDSLDTRRWKHLITGWRGGNNEFQYYNNRPENSYVKNGNLFIKPTLTADRLGESFLYNGTLDLNKEGCNINYDNGCIIKSEEDIINPIQSARMVTEDSFNFTYGSIIVRAKMPKGDWIWPAIWMLPTGSTYGEWPRSGEIDIAEIRGNNDLACGNVILGRQLAGSTLHWGPDGGQNQWSRTHWEKVNHTTDYSSDFHLYRVEWKSSGFQFYIDDQKIGEVSPPDGGFWQKGEFSGDNIWASGSKMAPFDKPFHFVLNVAVGGNFFPDGCGNKPWSKTDKNPMRKFWEKKNDWLTTWNGEDAALKIDYIRVYAL